MQVLLVQLQNRRARARGVASGSAQISQDGTVCPIGETACDVIGDGPNPLRYHQLHSANDKCMQTYVVVDRLVRGHLINAFQYQSGEFTDYLLTTSE